MSVSLPGAGGKGRGRSLYAELNLVPFIDLLSTCITFLLATAVWVQTQALDIEQAIRDPNAAPPPPDEEPPLPPLEVKIRADGISMGRGEDKMKEYPVRGDIYDWETLETDMASDFAETKEEDHQMVIHTEDGIFYEHTIAGLDLARKVGFERVLLGGGPPTTHAGGSARRRGL
jgi:biopolymer transport protein ExbD